MLKNSNYQIYASSKEAWEAMYQALLASEKSIYWELYTFVDDDRGRDFFDVLEQKARLGVDVKLIIDPLGSFWISSKRVQSLRKSGVDLLFFSERRHRYRGWWSRIVSRTHRKVLVVDEVVGFIGGVNIQKNMEEWLDIQVRLEGTIVHSLLRAFARSYILCGGDKARVYHLFRHPLRRLGQEVDFIFDEASKTHSRALKKYTEALHKARERVILFSPYYFPDRKFLQALWFAKKRGVRVDLLIPLRTDLRIASYAAYFWFTITSRQGVRIHILKNQMMHAKGVIVDDDWAMVGSSNLDHTSFYDCYEANVKIHDKVFVQKLKSVVEKWFLQSIPFDKMDWEKRSFLEKIKEKVAYRLYCIWHRRAKILNPYEFESKSKRTTHPPLRSDATDQSV